MHEGSNKLFIFPLKAVHLNLMHCCDIHAFTLCTSVELHAMVGTQHGCIWFL